MPRIRLLLTSHITREVMDVGQHNQFEPGWEVPNDGEYIEIGEHPDSDNSIRHPRRVHLHRGDTFPECSNANRKWTRVRGKHTK